MSRGDTMPAWGRALLAVPCALLGLGVSVCTVALHGYAWGLALGLAATAASLVALPAGWWSRLSFALGWVAVLVLVTPERAEGDFVVAGDVDGYLLLGAGILVFGAGFVGLIAPRGPVRDSGQPGTAP
ncbi:hypothetical protein [Nocardioides sp. WS12]|uniref:hypothetical protein n=1 Tax=Nocardioides sp. WS12 TaxID=2486272 RepID=UPI0015FAC18F|nr:hypothetical protein [Nocardioides sp. WS12]